jgi:outer membrane protein assembly factor BamB
MTDQDQTLTVGASEADDNVVKLFDVTDLRTGTVRDDGKVYVTKTLRGEEVRYALIRAGVVTTVESAHDGGSIVMNDVEKLSTGKILSNGTLFVGTDYGGEDVTVAVKVIDDDVDEEEDAENTEESPQQAQT